MLIVTEFRWYSKKNLVLFLIFLMGIGITVSKIIAGSQNSLKASEVSTSLSPRQSPLGINLSGLGSSSTQFPFIDYFKNSRNWFTTCQNQKTSDCRGVWDTKESEQLDLDEQGWVKSLPKPEDPPRYTQVATTLFKDIPQDTPISGQYLVLYDGEGTLEYGLAAEKNPDLSQPGRDVITIDLSKSNGALILINETDPNQTGNYLRNIRVIKAEDETRYQQGEQFNPVFLEKIKKFRTLRFMDWMQTNHSPQKEWKNRPTPLTATYRRSGVPLEVMIALANQVQAEPWFNIPHQATDEYIRNFAQKVKAELNSNSNIYVEFSNEVWNWNFKQTHYALEQGQARWGKDKKDAFFQWYGMRTAQMCEIWKKEFGNQANRVICVISTQMNYKGAERKILDCPYWVAEGNKPCYQGMDAYGITGYFSGALGDLNNSSVIESWRNKGDEGINLAFQQLKKGGLLPVDKDSLEHNYKKFLYHAEIAKDKGLKLVAYEGGQHLVSHRKDPQNQQVTDFLIKLNRHPQMYDTYLQLLQDWEQAGGTVFMHFTDIGKPTKYGSWGALESVYQPTSPKYKALEDFIDHNPCWWEGCQ
ncbi:Cellulose-binding domain protein [Planktothrix serta PCC 8927]|uniref:Cellulose-binding domain protein n=1 Tax=Planktothrix serta PCC 8927 TaxID=671068 RepID=A0A7Z9BRY7_9CYAN|nr:cellulose-binding protein [Planktothrix serta]VXD21644.1 Cellulose-binding domain protein [Planktothrix serta PCC 8927]